MMPSVDQVVVWIFVGLLGGSLAGLVITWDRRGFGLLRNLAVGLVGAFVGGLLFRLFGLLPGLEGISISLRDVVSAFVGSLIVLTGLWIWQRTVRKRDVM
ncbi:GlsB/YeaQ/YmgE family stress response membrane protein [Flaviflagellibacter deserti]|uniref:GlsB/YeaQ/YmgE family stress response membrane protein n=1 Tax=Flaviflagellibacter deserti TaxID=2267266 RepID=A0ABV9Z129_9HYPH